MQSNKKLKTENKNIAGFLAFCLFTLIFGVGVNAQTEQPPAPAEPRVATIPKPVEKTLANGLRVIVVERKNVPLVTAQLMIKSGGEVDPKNLAGAADMTAELLTKGTETRSATQIAEQIEFLGGSIESGAAWDASSVTVRVMSDKLDKAMEIAADSIKNPVFSEEEINRYKTQLLDELSVTLKQPGTLASYVANSVILGNTPYGHPLTGTPESINRIARKDLVSIHQTYYKPTNSVLVVAGDIAPNAVFSLTEKHLGNWKGQELQTEKLKSKIENSTSSSKKSQKVSINQITVVDLPNSGQAAVSVAQSGINRSNASYFQGLVANSVFGGGYSARLNQEVRIKRGLSYGAGSSLATRRETGIFSARAQTKNESAAEVAEIMINELNRLASEPIAETELTPRKAVLTGGFSSDLETTNGLVKQISELALYDLNLNQINSFIQNVQNINDEQTRQFVQDLYGRSGTNIIIVGDAKKFLPDLQKRFQNANIDVIPIADLDLNNSGLRKTTAQSVSKQNQ